MGKSSYTKATTSIRPKNQSTTVKKNFLYKKKLDLIFNKEILSYEKRFLQAQTLKDSSGSSLFNLAKNKSPPGVDRNIFLEQPFQVF